MVVEMLRLREMLNERGIDWKDASTKSPFITIDRTHFKIDGQKFSAINGYGTNGGYDIMTRTNGGYDIMTRTNGGLIELYDFKNPPIGYLTAEQVINYLEAIKVKSKESKETEEDGIRTI